MFILLVLFSGQTKIGMIETDMILYPDVENI